MPGPNDLNGMVDLAVDLDAMPNPMANTPSHVFFQVVNDWKAAITKCLDQANRESHTEWWDRNKRMPGVTNPPRPWILVESRDDGERWVKSALSVIWSVAVEQDAEFWMHLSVSKPQTDGRPVILPSYQDQKQVKALFIGEDRYAYSVWPPTDSHVNINRGVLHLWALLTSVEKGQALPDFTRGTGQI